MTTTSELDGNKFIELGHRFLIIHSMNKLTERSVNFSEGGVVNKDSDSIKITDDHCGTVACHGGWGCVLFNKESDSGHYSTYEQGEEAIANFLGFEPRAKSPRLDWYEDEAVRDMIRLERQALAYKHWASFNSDMWGNYRGDKMFSSVGYLAFGKEADECTLEDIGKHYISVGERIIEENKTC